MHQMFVSIQRANNKTCNNWELVTGIGLCETYFLAFKCCSDQNSEGGCPFIGYLLREIKVQHTVPDGLGKGPSGLLVPLIQSAYIRGPHTHGLSLLSLASFGNKANNLEERISMSRICALFGQPCWPGVG